MSRALRGLRVGLLERRRPTGYRGSLGEQLAGLLVQTGAAVVRVYAEEGLHGLDSPLKWDLVVVRSVTPASLHLAAAAEAWGAICINTVDASRLAHDKLASTAILQRAGLPIAPSHMAWLSPGGADDDRARTAPEALTDRPLIVKAPGGRNGRGLWSVEPGQLSDRLAEIPEGPYLLMERIAHEGDDLKVFVAGSWLAAIERPYPARTPDEKLGRSVMLPNDVAEVSLTAGELLGLTCYGCDYVRGRDGWVLVDVNPFPGYKGAPHAPAAIVAALARGVSGGTV